MTTFIGSLYSTLGSLLSFFSNRKNERKVVCKACGNNKAIVTVEYTTGTCHKCECGHMWID